MERVVANLDRVQPVRVTWNGRQYIVAKARMIVPGVLAGSQGALYYDPKDIGLNYQAWNHMPVVINHPRDPNSNHVTARDPKVLEKQGVGYVYNTVFDSSGSGCLDGEAWLDVEKLRKVSPSTLAAVEAGRPVEISTGLYTDNLPEDGVDLRSGKRYQFRAVNYRPDHLAILPNEKGACSVQDGCGLNVNQRKGVPVKLTPAAVERILANSSFFEECERDDKGHCQAGSTGGEDNVSKIKDLHDLARWGSHAFHPEGGQDKVEAAVKKVLDSASHEQVTKMLEALDITRRPGSKEESAKLVRQAITGRAGATDRASLGGNRDDVKSMELAGRMHHAKTVDSSHREAAQRDFDKSSRTVQSLTLDRIDAADRASAKKMTPEERSAAFARKMTGNSRGTSMKLTLADVERILANADSCPGCGGDIAQGICTKCGAIIRGNRRMGKNARNASLFTKRADNGCSGMGGGEQSSKIKVTKYPAPRNARGKFATHNQRTPTMRIRTRRDKVKYLTANCSCWRGKEALLANQDAFSDEDLDGLVTNTLVVNGVRGIVANARNEGGENFAGDDDRSDYDTDEGVYEANADDALTTPDDPDMKKRLMGLMDQYDEHETGEAANLLRALNKSLGKIGAARNSRGRASNARDSQGYGYDNDKQQGAAFARMREDGDLGDPVHENRAHNARARNARDSQGYGYDNDKQQGAAFARMREDGDLGDPVHENRAHNRRTKNADVPMMPPEEEEGGGDTVQVHRRAARNRATRNQEMSVTDYIRNAPPELRPILVNSLRQARELKFDIIERLVANSGLTGDQARSQVEWLSRHDLPSLQRMAAMLPPPRRANPANDPTLQMFLGAGMGGYPVGNADQNDVLDIEEARKSYDPALTGNKRKAE